MMPAAKKPAAKKPAAKKPAAKKAVKASSGEDSVTVDSGFKDAKGRTVFARWDVGRGFGGFFLRDRTKKSGYTKAAGVGGVRCRQVPADQGTVKCSAKRKKQGEAVAPPTVKRTWRWEIPFFRR